jgi:hypothetical protein
MRAEGAMTFGMIAGLAGAAGAAWIGAPSVLVALVAAIGLGWGAVRAGVLLARAGAPTPSRGQLRAVGLALLVVSTGVAMPLMSSPAEAQTSADERQCTTGEAISYYAFGPAGAVVATATGDECGLIFRAAINQEDEKTATDLAVSAASQEASAEVLRTAISNNLQDTETVAWSKAEIAVAEAYEAGKNETQAKAAAKQAIRDYYANRQESLEASYEAQAQSFLAAREVAKNESGISEEYVGPAQNTALSNDVFYNGSTNETLTLVNGETINTTGLDLEIQGDSFNQNPSTVANDGVGRTEYKGLAVDPGGENETILFKTQAYPSLWSQIETQSSGLTGEVDPYVSEVYQGLNNGTINSSDVISKAAYVGQLGTDYQNATDANQSNVYNSVGALASLGLETPDLNDTGTFTVEYQKNGSTVTADGLLAARAAPGGSWESNTTYNASNIAGPVYLAKTDGSIETIEGTFTITEIRNRDGEAIQNVTAEQVSYKSANVSELSTKLDRLLEYREQIEARSPFSGGIGGVGLGDTNPIVILVAAALALFLIGRSSNG